MIKTIILLTGLLTTISIQAFEFNYKTECIGSYTLQLPDNIEVALYPTERYLKPKSKYPIYFEDGKWAYLSSFNYNKNNLMITDSYTDDKTINEITSKLIKSFKDILEFNPQDQIEIINKMNLIGYYSNFGTDLTFLTNERIYTFYSNKRYQGKEQDLEFYKQNAESIITGFSTREIFDVPQLAGKCIPYGFVAGDNPSTPVDLGVSFRLNEHPDIVITFIENVSPFTNSLKFDAKDEMRHFWNYGYDYGNNNIDGIKLLGFPKNRSITMDGRSGVAGFVEIMYKDKSPSDYGYYAVVDYYSRNNQSIKDHPWLQLSVIGKRSESKGKTPLTKDEIYQLAKTIEASIIRRETER